MLTEAQRIANTREHLLWAYRVAIFWLVFAILIFGSAYLLADFEQMSEASHARHDHRHQRCMAGNRIRACPARKLRFFRAFGIDR